MVNIQIINRIKEAFTKRKIINRVEKVGFASAVVPNEAIQLGREANLRFPDVLVIDN
jgi:hypothetical protein